MRLFISVDMEGIAGVVSIQQVLPNGFEFQQARQWMTNEVIAVCETAFEHGFKEIVVADSHGTGQNILIDQLPAKVELVRSWPRPLGMAQGIEHGHFDAAALIGYHTGASAVDGVLSHTLFLETTEIRLNGKPASEAIIAASVIGHHGVPIVLVSGDDGMTAHARAALPNVETVTTKAYHSMFSARTIRPEDALIALRNGAGRAFSRLQNFKPLVQKTPVELEIRFSHRFTPEVLCFLKNVERVDAHTVRLVLDDMLEVSRFLEFLTNIRLTLLP